MSSPQALLTVRCRGSFKRGDLVEAVGQGSHLDAGRSLHDAAVCRRRVVCIESRKAAAHASAQRSSSPRQAELVAGSSFGVNRWASE
jgi:hypothetical protein